MQPSLVLDRHAVRWTFWIAMIALSGLIVANTLPYFTLRDNHAFLIDKGTLARDTAWRACFYAHVAGGIVCLVTGPFLVSAKLLVHAPWAHRVLGRAYVAAVLGCSGPAAVWLAWHARGGVLGQSGFLALDVAWMFATARGLQLVASGRIAQHRAWMMRSYALTLSAVFFRILHTGFFVAGVSDDVNYVVSLWLSLGVSLCVGEVLARAPSRSAARLHFVGGAS